ncbi:MAG: hypothetical protein KTQ49_08675 [Candidatus Omnitrophica bacterium]|nr:hypothetical protein [Candidatus Omnitrophota bacterium]
MIENSEGGSGIEVRVRAIAQSEQEILAGIQRIEAELRSWFSELCVANQTLNEKLKTLPRGKDGGGP